MMKLSHYLRPPRHRPLWTYAGAAVLVAGSIWGLYYARANSLSTDAALAHIDTERAGRIAALPRTLTGQQLQQQQLWAQLALERDFDWASVFRALQNADHPDIELLEFRPDKRQGLIALRGEAKSVAALSEYLRALGSQTAFSQVYLVKQDLRAHGQLETVGFEMRGILRK